MKTQANRLYVLTAIWTLLTVAVGVYALTDSMAPTADVTAAPQSNLMWVSVEDWAPGDARPVSLGGKWIVIWRRDRAEMARAGAQAAPGTSIEEWSGALADGSFAREAGPEALLRLEWVFASPVNVGGDGCMVRAQAGDFGGFFDPCQNVHFDMWGTVKKGPTGENLKVTPARFGEDPKTVLLDLSDMP